MHFMILGSGGIGAYYGACLQAAGHQVTFIARGKHLEAMRTHGLVVEHDQFPFRAPVTAMPLEQACSQLRADEVDYVLLCTKTMATAEIAAGLADWKQDSALAVVSLQNGVDNEVVLADRLGERSVIGGLSRRLGGQITEPGRVRAIGPCDTIVGVWPRSDNADDAGTPAVTTLANAMNTAGLPTEVSNDIRLELWRKLVLNNGLNPLSAVLGLDTRTLSHDPLLAPVVRSMMRETAAAAAADEVALSSEDADAMFELIRNFDAIKTSMLIDREHGRPLELEAIPGAVLARAERLGIDVPCTRSVHAILSHLVRS